MISLPVTVELKGERELLAHLETLPEQIRAKLLPVIQSLTARLLGGVRAAEPVRTGTLRGVTRSYVDQTETSITGKVKIGPRGVGRGGNRHNVAAAALEYGVHSSFKVAEHRMKLGHIWGRQISGEFVMVSEHMRRVSIAEQRFLRGPFERLRPFAEAEIMRALREVDL